MIEGGPAGADRSGERRRGPRPRLSRTLIAEAVLAVGFDQVTIAAVAAHLGVAPGALYRYVEDRDDLVIAGAEHVFASAAPVAPPGASPDAAGSWRGILEREAWARWDVLVAHPRMPDAVRSAGRPLPTAMARYELLVRRLVVCGFALDDAVLAVDTVVDVVHDGAHQATRLAGRTAAPGPAPGPDDGSVEAAMRAAMAEPRAFLARKLELVLEGIEAVLANGIPDRISDAPSQ